MRKNVLIFLIVFLSSLFLVANPVLANDEADIYFFHGQGCPHCAKEHDFLDALEKKYPELKIKRYEIWYNKNNAKLLEDKAREFDLKVTGVPVTFIGEEAIVGYGDDETTGAKIEGLLKKYNLIKKGTKEEKNKKEIVEEGETVKYPFLGSINLNSLSLPVLTIVLGTLDGFNPCAMWVLMFLIALLVNTRSRKKMWLVGGTFILASGVAYYIFIAAWLNVFLFIGYLAIVRFLIGVVAITAGVVHLKDFFKYKDGECKVTENKSRFKIIEKIKKITKPRVLPATLLGIIALAFSVNLVELFCSAGLPAIYTGILSLSGLSTPSYYLYLLFYIFLYMLDDLIIFIVAVITLNAIGFTGKFSRWSNLIGGVLILLLGLLLIFAPEVLMFN